MTLREYLYFSVEISLEISLLVIFNKNVNLNVPSGKKRNSFHCKCDRLFAIINSSKYSCHLYANANVVRAEEEVILYILRHPFFVFVMAYYTFSQE